MRLNQRQVAELRHMLRLCVHWHTIFIMQHGMDLEPHQAQKGARDRKRFDAAIAYFEKLIAEVDKG